ncbi:MAG: protein translocase subunit SecD [Candidatus Daviesbacteria bacterium]|nr:protein translocase subunit SecD [Candidatus Daviesbacteria bacterium]
MKSRWTLWIIVALTLVAIYVDLPKLPQNFQLPIFNLYTNDLLDKFPLKLGLDLQGGTQLILQTDMAKITSEDRDNALDSARSVIEKRVNLFGVSEAVVQSSKVGEDRRILVELPGLKDASSAAKLVGKTAQLDFRELPASAAAEASASGIPAVFFAKPTGLTGADLRKAAVTFGSSGAKSGAQVSIEFNDVGAKKFADITRRNIGKPLVIFLDDQPIEAPTVQQEINGGSAVITGQFTTEQAKDLSIQLNAGALPVPIKILEQRSIGPSLGESSIHKSLVAGVIGLSIVMLYMAIFYGFLGVIADLALIIYALITLAVFKTGFFILPPVTLTLAGIAGFILSIGMAVDANILIFERMNEEIRWGKSKVRALELGFDRAWSSIWASNVSSLMTAAILYGIGSSLVRGFAVTLAIGILVSLFTAIIVTRTFLRLTIK